MDYESRIRLSKQELENWVKVNYGLAGLVGQIRAGYMSTVAWFKTSAEQFVLKVYGEESTEQIKYSMDVTGLLGQSGLPVAVCMQASNGRYLVDLCGQKAALWSCLSGTIFSARNREQICRAGKMLGQFHNVFQHNLPNVSFTLDVGDLVEEMYGVWELVAERDGLDVVARLREHLDGVLGQLNVELPRSVLHCDYRGQNLLFEGSGISGILDLDGSCVGPRIFDAVYALAFFQAVIADGPLSESEMLEFLSAYHKEAELTHAELDGLDAWFVFALIKGLTLWLRIGYVERANNNARVWIGAYAELLLQSRPTAKRLVQCLRGNG